MVQPITMASHDDFARPVDISREFRKTFEGDQMCRQSMNEVDSSGKS